MLQLSTFRDRLKRINQYYTQKRYLLAVSGGVDSMVLLFLYHQLNLDFQVAHINYKLRGRDSDLDEKVVEQFCIDKNIPLHIYRVDEKDNKPDGSIQEWARDIRYRFFRTRCEEEHLDSIVTAHHLNDSIETFFMHLSRGSGIKGLCGIPEYQNSIVRPLLQFRKEELYAFAEENDIPFREDMSNAKNDYLRNQFRNIIIPQIEESTTHFIDNAQKSMRYLQDAQKFIETQIEEIEKSVFISKSENIWTLNSSILSKKTAFIQYEVLKKFGFTSPKEIEKIFRSETGKSFFSKTHQLLIDRECLEIRKLLFKKEKDIIIVAKTKDNLPSNNDRIQLSDFIDIETTFDWKFDLDKMVFPLFLRKKKEGDLFYPTGMTGKKKVSKFYKDKKLSIFAKENCWILCDNEQILGIPPFRQDRRKQNDNKKIKIVHITN